MIAFSEATSEVTLEVQVCIVFVIFKHLGLVLGHLSIDFESCHTRLITIQYIERNKLWKLKV